MSESAWRSRSSRRRFRRQIPMNHLSPGDGTILRICGRKLRRSATLVGSDKEAACTARALAEEAKW
jgi:hypothetical protein